ncbi:hypothetical protein [Pseudoxanthomonas mexicana]
MQTIADLIDAAKARTGANYTELGTRLDRSKQLITNWRSGAKVPTDGDVMALARMAGQDVDKWLAIAQAARTEGEAKTRWEQIARKLGAAAAMVLCALGFSLPMAGNARATKNADPMASGDVQGNAYYVNTSKDGVQLSHGRLSGCRTSPSP